MLKFNKERNEEYFSLDNVTYEEMFEVMKEDLALALTEYEKVQINAEDLMLGLSNCFRKTAFGEDGMLYPKIKLDVYAKKINSWMIIFNPFTIYLAEYDSSERRYFSNALDKTLISFMTGRFPNSSYLEKREKYFKNAEIMKKVDKFLLNI